MSYALNTIVTKLDNYFQIKKAGPDPAMSIFVPEVYARVNFNWQNFFEPVFKVLFNGLMIKGEQSVNKLFCSVFPTDYVLHNFIEKSKPGDLLFLHHPIIMECGDPRGKWGRGFQPINKKYLKEIQRKQLSVYTCHAPLDIHPKISTNQAIADALELKQIKDFFPYGNGFAGKLGKIKSISTDQLIIKLKKIFNVPYVDFAGIKHNDITRIAIVAGCGDKVELFQESENNQTQAYITGEIHCHINNVKGKTKMAVAKEYIKNTKMSMIGVSHAASEFLVMERHIAKYFKNIFKITVEIIPLKKWWF